MPEKPAQGGIAVETMNDTELWMLLRDPMQGTEAPAWQRAALELNRRLVVAQVDATQALVKTSMATTRATYALVAATIVVAIFSVVQGVLCLVR